jgi:hypothetical protein
MDAMTVSKKSLHMSYWLFFALVVALALMLAVASLGNPREGYISPAPFGLLFLIGEGWQVFTLYHNRRHLLTWILTILYGIPAALFLICLFRGQLL